LDEKWSFVFKKRGRCCQKELEQEKVGDCWDHIAFDPEHRLVLGVVLGRRSQGHIHKLVQRTKEQLQGRVPRLISTDGFSGYAQVFQQVYGVMLKPPRPKGRKQPCPRRWLAPQLTHAMVQKVIERGRVTEVKQQLAIGSQQNLQVALKASAVSTKVNTSFVERHNATDRHRNARKSRRSYRFSKNWQVHAAAGYFVLYSYNFCWAVHSLRVKREDGTYRPCTPAMAAGLATRVWTIGQWLRYPAKTDSS
jgi:IS1 family transposase